MVMLLCTDKVNDTRSYATSSEVDISYGKYIAVIFFILDDYDPNYAASSS